MSSSGFEYVLNIESEFLERHNAEHPHVLHRRDCSYFAAGVADTLPHFSAEVALEWWHQYGELPYERRFVEFCQRCVVTPGGHLRPGLSPV